LTFKCISDIELWDFMLLCAIREKEREGGRERERERERLLYRYIIVEVLLLISLNVICHENQC
jgi:hypothetical protein